MQAAFSRLFGGGEAAEEGLVLDGRVASVGTGKHGSMCSDVIAGHRDALRELPVDHRTLFCVFSISKAVSNLLVAQLVHADTLRYADAVQRHWTLFGQPTLTLSQLLSHRAGLTHFDESAAGVPVRLPVGALSSVGAGGDHQQQQQQQQQRAQWVALLERQSGRPHWSPEAHKAGYHAVTVGLYLAEVVKRALRVPSFSAAFQRVIAEPYGGIEFYFSLPPEREDNVTRVMYEQVEPRHSSVFLEAVQDPSSLSYKAMMPFSDSVSTSAWKMRALEMPSSNGWSNALQLARCFHAATEHISRQTLMSAAEPAPIRAGSRDLVLLERVRYTRGGFMLCPFVPRNRPHLFHGGSGGSFVLLDLPSGVSLSYTPVTLYRDARALRRHRVIINTFYRVLLQHNAKL